jgi:hypothetical protein
MGASLGVADFEFIAGAKMGAASDRAGGFFAGAAETTAQSPTIARTTANSLFIIHSLPPHLHFRGKTPKSPERA